MNRKVLMNCIVKYNNYFMLGIRQIRNVGCQQFHQGYIIFQRHQLLAA